MFIFGTELLKCFKYRNGVGGEVEAKADSSTSRTRSICIFQIILFKMELATLIALQLYPCSSGAIEIFREVDVSAGELGSHRCSMFLEARVSFLEAMVTFLEAMLMF